MASDSIFDHPAAKALLAEGAREGRVSYAQINDLLIDLELDELDVEELLSTFEKRAIAVVDETPAPPSNASQANAVSQSAPPKAKSKASAAPKTPKKSADAHSDLDDLLAELDKLEIGDDAESVAQFIADEEQDLYVGDDLDDAQAPVADALKIYLNRMGQIERLSPARERELAQIAHGDDAGAAREAKNALVEANLRLVVHMATKAAPRTTLSITDLLQEGNLGLLDAVERYRAQSNKTFGAYATWWIRRAMNRAINEQSRSMKLSGELYNAIQKLQNAQRELSQNLGRTPTRAEIAEATGLSVSQIEEAQRAASKPLSLEERVGGEGGTTELGETISGTDEDSEIAREERAATREVAQGIGVLLEDLSEREKTVVQMRFGLGDYAGEARSAEDVAEKMGISRERAHELELRAIRKLRKKAKGAGLDKLLGDES